MQGALILRWLCHRYASTEYVLQSSCTFAELAAAPADLSLEAAGAVGEFLAGHVGSLLASSDRVGVLASKLPAALWGYRSFQALLSRAELHL